MQFITPCKNNNTIPLIKSHVNTFAVTVTKEDIDYCSMGILDYIPLDINSAVLAGTFPLEIYYSKLHNKPLTNANFKIIQIYLFGSAEKILENINKIFTNLEKAYGNSTDKSNINVIARSASFHSDLYFIDFEFVSLLKIVRVYWAKYKNVEQLIDSFGSANEMCYWTNETGFVSSQFCKIACLLNQIVENPRHNQMVPADTLLELKTIGFNLSQYVKTNWLCNDWPIKPKPASYSTKYERKYGNFKWHNQETISDFNLDRINNSIELEPNEKPNFTQFDDLTFRSESYFVESFRLKFIKPNGYSNIVLCGKIKKITKEKANIIFFISDNTIAKKLIQVLTYASKEVYPDKPVNQSCLINTGFLTPEEKSLFNVDNQSKKIPDYSKESKVGIVCGSHLTQFEDDYRVHYTNLNKCTKKGVHQMPLDTELTIWLDVRTEITNNGKVVSCVISSIVI